jgi:hypothetical protein
MKINFNDLKTQYNLFKKDFDDSISKVLENQNFIMGSEVLELEKNSKPIYRISSFDYLREWN